MRMKKDVMIFPSNNPDRYDYCDVAIADKYKNNGEGTDYVDGTGNYMLGSLLTSDHPELSKINAPKRATIIIETEREIGWYAVEWKANRSIKYGCVHWNGHNFCQSEDRSKAMETFFDEEFKQILEVPLYFTAFK